MQKQNRCCDIRENNPLKKGFTEHRKSFMLSLKNVYDVILQTEFKTEHEKKKPSYNKTH